MADAHLTEVMPLLADMIHQMANILEQEGITIKVVAGLRTWKQQNALYAQGRTTIGHIVTNAPGGYSFHNYGLAVDCDPINKDGTIDWNASHPQWKRMEEVGVSVGLTSGANWIRLVDAPHFQYTKPFPENAPNDKLRQLYVDGGLQAVWDAIISPSTA